MSLAIASPMEGNGESSKDASVLTTLAIFVGGWHLALAVALRGLLQQPAAGCGDLAASVVRSMKRIQMNRSAALNLPGNITAQTADRDLPASSAVPWVRYCSTRPKSLTPNSTTERNQACTGLRAVSLPSPGCHWTYNWGAPGEKARAVMHPREQRPAPARCRPGPPEKHCLRWVASALAQEPNNRADPLRSVVPLRVLSRASLTVHGSKTSAAGSSFDFQKVSRDPSESSNFPRSRFGWIAPLFPAAKKRLTRQRCDRSSRPALGNGRLGSTRRFSECPIQRAV